MLTVLFYGSDLSVFSFIHQIPSNLLLDLMYVYAVAD